MFWEQITGFSFPVRVIVFLSHICYYCLNKKACHLFIAEFRKYIHTRQVLSSPFGGEHTEKDSEDRYL